MSVEREIINELDDVLASIRRAEQTIIVKDSSNKLKVVNKLMDLEESVKSIKNEITLPTLDITEDTLIIDLQSEKLLSARTGNILRRAGYKTVKDIASLTTHDLLGVRNMGKKSADEIIEFLRLFGFSLKHSKESEV